MTRDHGGNMDHARAEWGGEGWIDLSTGINRQPWPVPSLPQDVWAALPTATLQARAEQAAAERYGARAGVLALAGAQAAIQLYPSLGTPGRAAVLTPSYNEHAAALSAQGWHVTKAPDLAAMEGADLAVVVNPNNPDGRHFAPADLAALAQSVGVLVVDESFADPTPNLSLTALAPENTLILRSFGKFFGLAGVRLGFALGAHALLDPITERAGPWAVSGPALALGAAALADGAWISATSTRLMREAVQMDAMIAEARGWELVGGCALFRTYRTGDAKAAQAMLARQQIWTRRFPYSESWLRLGLPGCALEWSRLSAALQVPQ